MRNQQSRQKNKKKLNSFNTHIPFLKRECSKFIPTRRDPYKCGCGESLNFHVNKKISVLSKFLFSEYRTESLKWFSSKNTETSPTNAHGTIEFHYSGSSRKGQFIRLAHDSKPELIFEFLLKNWSLVLPKVIISVHGSISNVSLNGEIKEAFKKCLLQTVRQTSTWIITSGLNQGAARHVGETLNDIPLSCQNEIVAIGIAPWGTLEMREQLNGTNHRVNVCSVNNSNKPLSFSLESHHTHFLLADNGTSGKFGAEVVLRKKLEKYISEKRITKAQYQTIPIVGVIMGGGPFTLLTVLDYIYEDPPVPIIAIEGTGKTANLLSFIYKSTDEQGNLTNDAYNGLLLEIQNEFKCSSCRSRSIIRQLLTCVRKKELITIFTLSDSEDNDIDAAIFKALFKGRKQSPYAQLMWTLTWDRVDIAQSQIFKKQFNWTCDLLHHAMMEALIGDKVDFVKLLLDHGVNMQDFLTITRLEYLYNTFVKGYCGFAPIWDFMYSIGLVALLKESTNNILCNILFGLKLYGKVQRKITLTDVGAIVEKLIGGSFQSKYRLKKFRECYQTFKDIQRNRCNEVFQASYFQDNNYVSSDPKGTFQCPYNELFLWAVLLNRQQMALFMWQHGDEPMAKALIACKLNSAMAEEVNEVDFDIYEDFLNNSKEFCDLALNLLKECSRQDELYSQQLLVHKISRWSEETCLSLAAANKHLEFVAHNCCQSIISQMWLGNLHIRQHRNKKIILGILFPPIIVLMDFWESEPRTDNQANQYISDIHININCEKDSQCKNGYVNKGFLMHEGDNSMDQKPFPLKISQNFKYNDIERKLTFRICKKFMYFYKAPITKFWFHSISYFVFVLLYIYVVLTKLNKNYPSIAEWWIIIYIYTIALERIRDLLLCEGSDFTKKLTQWMDYKWNIGDTIAIIMFTVGMIMRFHHSVFKIGRWIYCLNIIFWIIRILDIFSFHMYLGPYVMTIKRMIKDVAYFAIILFIMILAFGVSKQAILNPNKEFNWLMVEHVLYQPFFIVFGELFVEDINPGCDIGKATCTTGAWVTPILMAIYLLMTYMLLVNLLIAKFNHTFASVQSVAEMIWKFQRYNLTIKYSNYSISPPPFTIISHLYELIHYLYCLIKRKEIKWYSGFKQDLTHEHLERLHAFEMDCLKVCRIDFKKDDENDNQLQNISQRTEGIQNTLQEERKKLDEIITTNRMLEFQMESVCELTKNVQKDLHALIQLLSHKNMDKVCISPRKLSKQSSTSVPNLNTLMSNNSELQKWNSINAVNNSDYLPDSSGNEIECNRM